jgi:hypothetical protein
VCLSLQKKAAVPSKGGKAQNTKKKTTNKFYIDCTTAETDSILDCTSFVRPHDPSLLYSFRLKHKRYMHVNFTRLRFTCAARLVCSLKALCYDVSKVGKKYMEEQALCRNERECRDRLELTRGDVPRRSTSRSASRLPARPETWGKQSRCRPRSQGLPCRRRVRSPRGT